MAVITLAGEAALAAHRAAQTTLVIDRFILANIPGLDVNLPESRAQALPPLEERVYTAPVTQVGYITPNKVVYSLIVASEAGDFSFNWMGLLADDDTLIAASHFSAVTKTAAIGESLTRNFVLSYEAVQSIVAVNVAADTWQFDFTDIVNGVRSQTGGVARLLFGAANFVGEAFKVVYNAGQYELRAGSAVVDGVFIDNAATQTLAGVNAPTKVWLDVFYNTIDATAYWSTVLNNAAQADYVDVNGYQHRLIALADIPSAGQVLDSRPQTIGSNGNLLDMLLDASSLLRGILPGARFNDTSHGNRGGGNLHQLATTALAGFMSAADKVKLNKYADGFNDATHGNRGGGSLHQAADENQDGFMRRQDYTLLEHMRYDTLALQSLSSWAWRLLPAGGVIINGGRLLSGGVSDDQTRSMTFHTAFPNWCLTVLVAPVHADAPSGYTYPTVIAFSQTGFTVKMRGPYPADWGFHFIAIGY